MKQNINITRPAWVEIDLAQLRRNFEIFASDRPANVGFMSIVKDDAYGHGLVEVARVAEQFGCAFLGVVTVDEGIALRQGGISKPILLLGERTDEELDLSFEHNLTCCINDLIQAKKLQRLCEKYHKTVAVHVEIDSGMSRYGVRWSDAMPVIEAMSTIPELELEGVMSHFAMSDELDKSFARHSLQGLTRCCHRCR